MAKNKIKLAAFDFDNTIINVNSDTYINKLIETEKKVKFPSEIEDLRDTHGWTQRMNAVFSHMFTQHNIRKADYLNCVSEIKIDHAMIDLLRKLKQNDIELIIISDANTVFIETILAANGISEIFSTIYTNPALFDDSECLRVTPFNQIFNKNGEVFECKTRICEKNMCKGTILKHHIENSHSPTERVIVYVGDGQNDFCPGLYLKESDFYFVRKGYSLEKLLNKKEQRVKLSSKIHYWNNANQIIEALEF